MRVSFGFKSSEGWAGRNLKVTIDPTVVTVEQLVALVRSTILLHFAHVHHCQLREEAGKDRWGDPTNITAGSLGLKVEDLPRLVSETSLDMAKTHSVWNGSYD